MYFGALLLSELLLAAGFPQMPARLRPAATITHRYPVHYDGPFVSHGRIGARPASDVSLPSYHVTYHGGPVEQATQPYMIYWFPSSPPPTGYRALVDSFLLGVGGSSFYGVASSYSTKAAPIQNKSMPIEADVDSDPFPRKLDVNAIEDELAKLATNLEIPATPDDPILVFLPKDAPLIVKPPSVCALHGAFEFQNKKATTITFAVVPYQGGNPACEAYRAPYKVPNPSVPGGDAAITNVARELLEIVTDPLGDGWYDDAYGEVGDICFFDYGDPGLFPDQANYEIGTMLYQIPEAYERKASACRPSLGGGAPQPDAIRGLAPPPEPVATPGVTYHGGPIQPGVTAYSIFWGNSITGTFQQNVERFLSDLNGGDYLSVLTQYAGTNGSIRDAVRFGGAYLDSSAPPKAVSMKVAGQEVLKALAANPAWTAGLSAQFYVYTPAGILPSPSFCGSHSSLSETVNNKRVYVVYAYIPSATGPCTTPFDLPSPTGDVASDEAIKTMGHEGAEMMTDPIGNGWKGSVKDTEVADLCIGNFGMLGLMTSGANLTLNGHPYRVQELWSQSTGACAPNL
jgi:hypothetical protein